MDIQIAFALPAIAKDADLRRVGGKLTVEVEDVAMRISLAQNRHKSENRRAKAKAGAVRRYHCFPRQLAGGIQRRLHRERAVFGRGENVRLAIDRSGRGEGDPPDARGPHCFKDVMGGEGILLQIAAGMRGARAHVGISRQVENLIVFFHGHGQSRQVQRVADDQAKAGMSKSRFDEAALAGGEVVIGGHVMPIGQQAIDQMAADETCSAGDEITCHVDSDSVKGLSYVVDAASCRVLFGQSKRRGRRYHDDVPGLSRPCVSSYNRLRDQSSGLDPIGRCPDVCPQNWSIWERILAHCSCLAFGTPQTISR